METRELIPNLFKTEFTRITAVLCKKFGIAHWDLAEDMVCETFLLALETWPYKGIPENQQAWLYTVAKNKVINHLKRNKLFSESIAPQLQQLPQVADDLEIDLSDKNIKDSQLQMLFAICHPAISAESQIGLALRSLCGFGIEEIANAFLTSKETIHKRLFRAKEKLRKGNVQINFTPAGDVQQRLKTVLITLYLLFNEGYYSESNERLLRKDFCLEAMRLTKLLIDHAPTNKPEVNALMALMCFHASRFDARLNKEGGSVLYDDQDELQWNQELVANGVFYLKQASHGEIISTYHLEAGIAYWHTIKSNTTEKWEHILKLYHHLLAIDFSPVAKLNSMYALSKVKGKQAAIDEVEKFSMPDNRYYYTLLGELYTGNDHLKAKQYFEKALLMTKNNAEISAIRRKINDLDLRDSI